jgi:hypothetical protein
VTEDQTVRLTDVDKFLFDLQGFVVLRGVLDLSQVRLGDAVCGRRARVDAREAGPPRAGLTGGAARTYTAVTDSPLCSCWLRSGWRLGQAAEHSYPIAELGSITRSHDRTTCHFSAQPLRAKRRCPVKSESRFIRSCAPRNSCSGTTFARVARLAAGDSCGVHSGEVPSVTIAGYTNDGKSSLLNH